MVLKSLRRLLLVIGSFFVLVLFWSACVWSQKLPKTLIAGALRDFPPQYVIDAQTGEPTGFAIDIMTIVAERAGLSVQYVLFDTWQDAQQALRDKRIDIIPNMGITDDRKPWMLFTQPFEVFDVALFVRASTHDIHSLDDLCGQHVAVVATNIGATLVQSYEEVTPVLYHTVSDALLSLLSGHTDALIYPTPPLNAIARNAGLEKRIQVVGKPLVEIKRALAVRQDRPELLTQFDKAARELVESPTYRDIYVRWYGEPSPFWNAVNVSILMGSLLIVVIIGAFLWRYYSMIRLNALLRRTITERNQAEDVLRKRDQQLREQKEVLLSIMARDPRRHADLKSAIMEITEACSELILSERVSVWQYNEDYSEIRCFDAYTRSTQRHSEGEELLSADFPSYFGSHKRGHVIAAADVYADPRTREIPADYYRQYDIRSLLDAPVWLHGTMGGLLSFEQVGEPRSWSQEDERLATNMATLIALCFESHERERAEETLRKSERLLRSIADNYPHSYVSIIEKDLTVGFTSGKEFQAQQIDPDSFVGLSLVQVFGEHAPFVKEQYVRVFQGEDVTFELFINSQHQLYSVVPLSKENGKIERILAVVENITARKQAENALIESERKYRQLFDLAQEGIWVIDADAITTIVNPSMAKMLGYTEEEMIGQYLFAFMDEQGVALASANLERRRQGIREQHDFEFLHKNGTRVYVTLETTPMFDDDGAYAGLIAGVMDITARKVAEQDLRESEEKYRLQIEMSPDGIGFHQDGKLVFMNQAGARLLGAESPEQLIGKPIQEIVHPDGWQEAGDRIRRMIAGETGLYPAEDRYVRLDGSVVPVEVTAAKFTFQGKPAIQVVARDITDRKRAELALKESEERFRRALENIPDVIVIYDIDLRIRYINAATTHITGRPVSDFLGKRDDEIWPPELYEAYLPTLREAFETQTICSVETKLNLPDMGCRYLSITCVPLLDRQRNVREILGITHDFTERKQSEQELMKHRVHLEELVKERTAELHDAQEELVHKEKLAILGQLAGGVAHELRNPLGAISNIIYYLNLLLEQPDEKVAESLEIIQKEIDAAVNIISSLLDFAQPKQPVPQQVDLAQLIRNVLAASSIPEHIIVETNFNELLPPAMADPGQLEIVFGNIMRNAVQAMSEGGRLGITIATESGQSSDTDWIAVSMADTGEGIPKEHLHRLFEPLFTTKARGIGLGLALVKNFVEANRGTLSVISEVEKGSNFTVRLPVKEGHHT